MAYPKSFIRVSFLFRITGTDEVAQTGFNATTLGAAAFDAEAALGELGVAGAQEIHDEMSLLMNTGLLRWSEYSEFYATRLDAVGTDGNILTDPVIYEDTPPVDTGVQPDVIPQSTLVVTLFSGLTFGRANYGRLYLPHCQPDLETGTPFISPGTTAAINTGFRGRVDAWNAVFDGVVPASGVVLLSSIGAGTVKAPAVTRVGNVIDTQRRRRNRLVEVYDQQTI